MDNTPTFSFIKPILQTLQRRLTAAVLMVLIIVVLTQLGLNLAERGRQRLPSEPGVVIAETLRASGEYLFNHPTSYVWSKVELPALRLVQMIVTKSAVLLLASLAIAVVVGVPLGIGIALARRDGISALGVLFSILGVSIPSFLLAMLFGVANIRAFQILGEKTLPATGYGLDLHLVMPALVLAARPLAQITRITYISLTDILSQDFIRVVRAKGAPERVIQVEHALRNAWIPILTTIGASMRLSLASLPVVEYFFVWGGVGATLLKAIDLGMNTLVVDLFISLGLLFLLINTTLELLYPLIDPRVGQTQNAVEEDEAPGLLGSLGGLFATLRDALTTLFSRLKPAPKRPVPEPKEVDTQPVDVFRHRPKRTLADWLDNPALLVGLLLAGGMVFLAVFGGQLTAASPYQINGVMMVDGEIGAPPFEPTPTFPWGTDHIGRDIQAQVLAGARQTLALGFFGMLTRVLIGSILGLFAGWRQNGRFDRLVMWLVSVWGAFPATIFAMILILGLGIQNGMWVFVLALGVVGWDEIAQVVRSKVIELKPKEYIEAAWSIGMRPLQILSSHVLPNLMSAIILLAVLEMGGVLMLLAELGMLNIYLGGGFRVEFGPEQIAYFSDVPEWGALLANVRNWWRSYPWMAWYPGVAFFLSILGFNLLGEGLRRFLDRGRVNIRTFNRGVLAFTGISVIVLLVLLRSTAPLGVYTADARRFDEQRAYQDVQVLASDAMQGRDSGSPGADMAAMYIAQQMEAAGLLPAGEDQTFIQTFPCSYSELKSLPRLTVLDKDGKAVSEFAYRTHFVEFPSQYYVDTEARGQVVGVAVKPFVDTPDQSVTGDYFSLAEKIGIIREEWLPYMSLRDMQGVLIVTRDARVFSTRQMFSGGFFRSESGPVLYITEGVAEHLLHTAGSSLTELDELAASLPEGQFGLTQTGAHMAIHMDVGYGEQMDCQNVIGILPGTGALMGDRPGAGLDSQVILIAAHYDGMGVAPDGVMYPSANDNASGVATMLELARLLKSSPHPPEKTIVFTAWTGMEHNQSFNSKNIMNAMRGLNLLTLEAVIEINAVGAGDGNAIALGPSSSYRLVQLFERSAKRTGARVTTLGDAPHSGGSEDRADVMGRSALSLFVGWDGSSASAHTLDDNLEAIDPRKLNDTGETLALHILVMSHHMEY